MTNTARDGSDEARRAADAAPVPPDGCFEVDAQGTLVRVAARALELYGIAPDEARALVAAPPHLRTAAVTAATRARVRDPETFKAALQRAVDAGDEVTFDEIELVDGRVLERYGVPLHADDGQRTGRLLTMRDVSARRRADAEGRDRARQQAVVADLGELALNAEDPSPLLQLATRLVASTLRVDLVNLLELLPSGETFTVHTTSTDLDPHRRDPVDAATSLAGFTLRHGAPVVILDLADARVPAPRLRSLAVTSAIAVVVRGRDRPFGVLGAYSLARRAFTSDELHFVETVANVLSAAIARSGAETALFDRERQLRAVFENALDGFVTLDDSARVVEANAAACALFGRSRPEMAGYALLPLLGPSAEQARAAWRELLGRGRLTGELEVVPPRGVARHVEFSAVARILPGLHLGVLRDVTAQRALQARLAIADRMASVGTLAAGVAHELNNPLSYVAANLSWLAERLAEGAPGDSSEVAEALAEARGGADRMRDIIRDLRTFSRADERRCGPVELGPVVESCVSMAWNEIRHRARLVRDLAPVPPVEGNEARLGQVLLNLLVNAAQAIREGDAERNAIRVATRQLPDGRIALEVSDTGCGIAPEHRPRIFDPFFTTKAPGVGTGLGLSICHNLVAAMGGTIEVESEVGRGSTFRVLLRVAPQRAPLATDPVPAPLPRRGRVLVVDDEALVAAAVRRALASEHEVLVAGGASEALARHGAGERWDVIVSDLLMPDVTGMDLERELRARDPDLASRMVFVTGGAFTPASRAFVEEHRDACVEKPFDIAALRALVRRRMPPSGCG
ncbi:MAG: ATP-binding protein [Anaeromyxobacteraceae bacterium]